MEPIKNSKDKVIIFNDLSTYPPEIQNLLSAYSEFKSIFYKAEILENDYESAIEDFARSGESALFQDVDSMKSFMRGFADTLSDWSFVAYHITRVVNPEEIRSNGLKVLNSVDYIKRMWYVFRNHLGYSDAKTEECLALLNKKIGRERVREKTLSFFAPNSRHILCEKSGGYLSLYGSVVGGEIAHQSFLGRSEHTDLSRIGKTVIVKAKFHICDLIRKDSEFGETYGFFCFMFYLASQLNYTNSLDYNAYILGQVTANVEPKDIIEIKRYP